MVYRLHSLTLHGDGMGAAVHIPDVLDLDTPLNPQHLAELVGHVIHPTHAAIVSIQPVITFSTFAIPATLDLIGATGFAIDSTTNPGLLLNLGLVGACGDFASGSVHRTIAVRKGCIVPMRISVDNRGNARLQCGVYPIQKAALDVLEISDTAALPTIAVEEQRWTLGPVEIDGVDLDDYSNFDVDFGNRLTTDGAESSVYDTHVMERAHQPAMTIRGIDPTWLSSTSVPFSGAGANHADTIIYLRKRTMDGTHFVLDATAEHIKISMAGVLSIDAAFRGQASRVGESSLRITGARDAAGNAPLTINTASAIT